MAVFAENDQLARTIFAFHSTDPLVGNNKFCGKIIQVNPETTCAFRAHERNGDVAGTLCIDFSFVTKWTDNFVFYHQVPPLQCQLYIMPGIVTSWRPSTGM